MTSKISSERKTAYYLGGGLCALGLILFLSTFVSFISHFGDFTNFEGQVKGNMARALGGMALIFIGGILRGAGARGLAGSGIVLNPDQAREDLKPYAQMAGGIVQDALQAADVDLSSSKPERVVMIKCRECGKLNEEDSRFCQECGKAL